jgi:ribonuclease G
MSKEIYISSTPHETRLAIVEDEALTEIYYERENEYTLAGSIYNGRVTRVLPGMQSSFVDIGLERDAFLYITDFMEETPDSDEFDTTSASDRTPRTINAEPARTESAPRSAERGDRSGRGRRGGRDRDRNQDRGSAERTPSDRPTSDRSDRSDRAETPRLAEPGLPLKDAADNSEIGEGAPGADGNRRWRGRRGRRRGRGTPGQPGDQPQENIAPTSALPEDDPSFDPDSYRPIEAAAESPEPTAESVENHGERGSRDEGHGQRREGQRFDSPRREQRPDQRPPRGFAPSRSLYGADSTGPIANAYPDADSTGTAEQLILPGESLSKYRKGDEPAASSSTPANSNATTVTLAPPASIYTVAPGWDGGAVLPGETLSRRRPADSSSESRPPQREFDRDNRRDNRPGREARHEGHRDNRSEFRNNPPAAVEAPAAVEEAQVLSPSAEIAPKFIAPSAPEPHESPIAASIDAEVVPVSAPEPTPQVDVEYEPTSASVSYRVDPVAPSEFRHSAPTQEPPLEFSEFSEEVIEATSANTITPTPSEPVELHPDNAPVIPVDLHQPLAEAHDVTSISATGEMFSEPVEVLPDPLQHPAPIETAEPASPLRHEGAVITTNVEAEFLAPAVGVGAAIADFAPGSGQLDEEILDEDDSEATTLHASSIEEIDDVEEETLEGTADLGTMLREMSIDHITRTLPEVEEEDDEEDDLEEDDLDEDEEEDDEEGDDQDPDQDGQEGYQLVDPARTVQSPPPQSEDDDQEEAARTGNAADAEFFEQQFGQNSQENRSEQQSDSAPAGDSNRDLGREPDRRGGRRDGRRGRNDRDRGDRSRRPGQSSGHGRHSMQSTNLPAISDLLKPGQEILVQIAKEPIAKKGARITSHIALPGRFLVFMPTVNHTGVSRKIESDGERRRLKEILLSEKGDATGGFIVRTAAEGASEEELRSDLRFLLNLWADIKTRSESSKSPALIYHDLSLVERILRDQVTDNFSAIWVDTEDAYERVLRFLQRFQPSLIRRVKLYLKDTPLFEQFGITEEINKALRSKVWLKSGGSIVINQTEALVAIDINTGKFVGKTARLEDTIVKTNLDAIPEIVRQIRLRDLGGIIIIDFIDMDERKNRNRVMAALEDELKSDRAPSKVLQFNDFGLVAITRKRVKQSLERTLSTPCAICTGTGMVKSPITVCNDIYIEMRKMHKHLDHGDVMLRVHPEVVKQLKSSGAKWLQEMEEMAGKTILVKSDPSLHPEQFDIH